MFVGLQLVLNSRTASSRYSVMAAAAVITTVLIHTCQIMYDMVRTIQTKCNLLKCSLPYTLELASNTATMKRIKVHI